jgi:arylsulfatase
VSIVESVKGRRAGGAGHNLLIAVLVVLLVGGWFVLSTSDGTNGSGVPKAERVLLITCDTLRADRLGVYGAQEGLTPNLDAFAADCVVFDKAYSSAPLTSASFSAMMTGRLPDELGMSSNKVLMPQEAQVIAEIVSAGGIPTAAIVSNWVLRNRKRRADGFAQGFDSYDDQMTDSEVNRPGVMERDARGTTQTALRWLKKRPGDRFFLWVHYQDPHGPYTPPTGLSQKRVGPDKPVGPGPDRDLPHGETQIGLGEIPEYQVIEGEHGSRTYRQRYEVEIAYFDRELGRLLDGLESMGLLEGALVLFTTDHGESLGEHDYWFSHGQTVYDELVHVPFLVRYPDGAPRPRAEPIDGHQRVAALVGHIDVLATVADAFGLPAPRTHGTSLFEEELPTGRLIPQHLRAPEARNRWEGLTDGRWRLVKQPGRVSLYDLESDPGEEHDLAASNPDKVRELEARYDAMRSRLPPLGAKAQHADLTQEEIDKMNALGYGGEDG